MQMTVREAAKCLRVPESTVRRWIRDRGLPAVKFHEQYRLNGVDLQVWAQSNQIPIDPEELAAREPARHRSRPPSSAAGPSGSPGDDRRR